MGKVGSLRSKFAQENRAAYASLMKYNRSLLDEVFPRESIRWNYEKVIDEAKKFSTKREWAACSPKSYGAAQRHGWLNDHCLHFPNDRICVARKVINIDTGEIFDSAQLASLFYTQSKSSVSNAIRRNARCGGFHWAYYDENNHL